MDDVQIGNGNQQEQEVGDEEFPAVLGQIHFQEEYEQEKHADPELDVEKTPFGEELDVMEGIVGDGDDEKHGHAQNHDVETVQDALSGIAEMS